MVYDVVIVGGGPAGYTAAMYAAEAGLSALVLEKLSAGGQMALTDRIDNYPGFPEGIDGFLLGEKMEQGAHRAGAATELAEVRSFDLHGDPKRVDTSEGPFFGKTVILATGAQPRQLGLPEEQKLTGKGVHYCAHCDGHFYRGKTVAVVGGGNSAAADALQLSRVAKQVYLIHRRDTLRAASRYEKALAQAENVEFLWDTTVEELISEDRLTGVSILKKKTGLRETLLLDGLFISVGRNPITAFPGMPPLDAAGYIVAGESTETGIPGVFAAGDVRTKLLRQIVTAAADGATAAHMAQQYLTETN